jgi:hypothetical protein
VGRPESFTADGGRLTALVFLDAALLL